MEVLSAARRSVPLSDAEFVGRLEGSTATPADDRGAVAAGQRVSHLFGTIRAVEGTWVRVGFRRILRARCHEEEDCTIPRTRNSDEVSFRHCKRGRRCELPSFHYAFSACAA